MIHLPDDILYMVCAELWHQQDYNTLFNCASSGKTLAAIAVPNLYRMQGVAPSYREMSHSSYGQMMLIKCADLWRTIILSSLGKTLYPYSRYIRSLNLEKLDELLQALDSRPSGISTVLLHGELAQFRVENPMERFITGPSSREEITRRIGEAITKQTPLLEELTGNVLLQNLSGLIPRLPRLISLKIDSAAIMRGNGTLIRLHCPSFKRLKIRDLDWYSDEDVAAFISELRPQSLESFQTKYCKSLGPIFHALSCHAESLIELKLDRLTTDAILKIPLLKDCTNLVSLSSERSRYDLKNRHNDLFLEMAAWLKECKKLRTLAFAGFFSAPALITPILLDRSMYLTSLKHEGFTVQDSKKFHQALAYQTSLQYLWLDHTVIEKGAEKPPRPPSTLEGDLDKDTTDTEVLVESLSKLVNLTDLHLLRISNSFKDRHIMQLASSLSKLEVWSTSGFWLTDAIWGEVASLRSLRTLDLRAVARFTDDGILDFIEKIGNKGLDFSVRNVHEIPTVKLQLIQETIAQKINGRFNFKLTSVPENFWSDSES